MYDLRVDLMFEHLEKTHKKVIIKTRNKIIYSSKNAMHISNIR